MKKRVQRNIMWTHLLFVLGLTVLISACSQSKVVKIPATGDIVAKSYDLAGFNEVEIAGFFEAEVTQGNDFKVLVEAERDLIPYLEVQVRGGRLFVGLKHGVRFNFEDASQRVEVTLPTLVLARIDNHSTVQLRDFAAVETLKLDVAGFSTLHGLVEADEVQVEVSNHSTLNLAGSASRVTGDVSGFSSTDLDHLEVSEIELDVDGNSTLTP